MFISLKITEFVNLISVLPLPRIRDNGAGIRRYFPTTHSTPAPLPEACATGSAPIVNQCFEGALVGGFGEDEMRRGAPPQHEGCGESYYFGDSALN